MTKVIKSELTGGQLTKLTSMLENEATESAKIINALEQLSCVLVTKDKVAGEVFEKVRSKVDSYKTVLEKRKSTASELASAITSGAQTLAAFMEDESVLDDREKEEVKRELQRAKTNLNNLKNQLNSYNIFEKGFQIIFKNQDWKALKSGIRNWESQIPILEKKCDKLERLASMDSQTYGPVSAQSSNISSYASTVSGIKRSSISIPHEI